MPAFKTPIRTEVPFADGIPPTMAIRPLGRVALPSPPLSGTSWPRVRGYEILSVIGSGGMGIVYKARHRDLRRTVALKMLRGAGLMDPELYGRFQAEAEAVARLQHPNIIQVFEIGAVEPMSAESFASPFIALEFVDGGCLAQGTDRPQPPRYVAELVEKLARAVHSAHRLGVVHRDLKPANVLLTDKGEPKIADFGVAKQLETARDAGGRFLTQAGTVVGTPEYMAPEQARGEAPTEAVDIYALGVILYELLTGRVPFHAATPMATMNLLQRQEPVPPRQLQPGLPRDLETICLKCVEKDPGKRYATAEALADDLRCFLDHRQIRARRLSEIDKLARWCRRNPQVAALLAVVFGVFLAAFVLVSRSRWRAEAAWHEEAVQREEAQRKQKAERWERYRANIVATASALEIHNAGDARRTLNDAPQDFRNWEWRHFLSRLDRAQQVLRADEAVQPRATITVDGSRAVLFGANDFMRVWNTTDGKEVRTFRNVPEFLDSRLSPDGKILAHRTSQNAVTLIDIDTGEARAVLRGHQKSVYEIRFNTDGSRVVTTSEDQSVRVWDAATGQLLKVLRPPSSGSATLEFHLHDRRVICSELRRTGIGIWDLETGKLIASLPDHERLLQDACFNAAGDRVVTVEGFLRNEVRLWNAMSGQLVGVMAGHDNTVTNLAFSPDGTRFATSSMDQTVRLWDGRSGRRIATLRGHKGHVTRSTFSPDSKHLASASEDHTVRLWDAETGEALAVLDGHTGGVKEIRYSNDGKRIVSTSADGTIRCWDAHEMENFGILRGHATFVYSVAFHPDGERAASASWDGTVRIWDVTSGRQLRLLNLGEKMIGTSVAFHPDGHILAARTRESITLWDCDTGRQLHRWDMPSDSWRDTRLAFSPDGSLLASGCPAGDVRLWDVASRAEVAVLRGHRNGVRDVAFSRDGKWLATAAEAGDRTVRIWDLATKETSQVLEGHNDCVYALAVSPDGKLLASGSCDGTARLWDTSTWRAVATLQHGTNVYGMAFTRDGSRLACGCADNSIRFWDTATHQPVAQLRGHLGYVHAVAFSPDGTRLVSASGDGTVRAWDTIRPQDRIAGVARPESSKGVLAAPRPSKTQGVPH